MNCRDVGGSITAYLDGELDEASASALRGHLRLCAACRGLAEDHADLVRVLSELPAVESPPALWQGVLAQLGEAEVADARRPRWWRHWRRLRPQLLPAAAMAAAAVTVAVWLNKRGQHEIGEISLVAHQATPSPAAAVEATESGAVRDVVDEMAEAARAADDAYRAAADELLAMVDGERSAWTAASARMIDDRIAELRTAVDHAPPGEARERAWQALVAYVQRLVTGDRIAEVER